MSATPNLRATNELVDTTIACAVLDSSQAELTILCGPAEQRAGGIEPVDGWHLCYWIDGTSETFSPKRYVACRDGVAVDLDLSAHLFRPSQERWEWFVRAGFPSSPVWPSGVTAPWNDEGIDCMIRASDPAAMRRFMRTKATEFVVGIAAGLSLWVGVWVMLP